MSQHHAVTIIVNDQYAIDAGNWQECIEEKQRPYRLVSPPHISMYRQVLSYHVPLLQNEERCLLCSDARTSWEICLAQTTGSAACLRDRRRGRQYR